MSQTGVVMKSAHPNRRRVPAAFRLKGTSSNAFQLDFCSLSSSFIVTITTSMHRDTDTKRDPERKRQRDRQTGGGRDGDGDKQRAAGPRDWLCTPRSSPPRPAAGPSAPESHFSSERPKKRQRHKGFEGRSMRMRSL